MRRSTKQILVAQLLVVIMLRLMTGQNSNAMTRAIEHKVEHTTRKEHITHQTTTTLLVSPSVMAKWAKVNICEEGGDWYVQGSHYSGGLGITNSNWIAYGGLQFARNGGLATPAEQVVVARRIEAALGFPEYVPDQNGCGHGW